MNPYEHQLRYPWPEVPAIGTAVVLQAGLRWIRMPLPFALDHINLWLLDDEIDGRAGYTLIDCGITDEATQQAWETLFATAFGGKPLLRVICTHFHPDHFGLAHWLTVGGHERRWNVPLAMTATEYAFGRFLSAGGDDLSGEPAARHFARNGLADPDALAKVRARGSGYYPKLVPAVPPSYHRIQQGDRIVIGPASGKRSFDALIGYGHAPEHLMLYSAEAEMLVAGDMVLPRISTNVSVFDVEPEGNPLPLYLRSLDQLLRLPADTLVLPSHGKPFYGLHERIAQQHQHHAERLAEVLAACATPQSAADIVPVLFKRTLDLHQTTFALGESLAHLHALWFEGKVTRRHDDGVFRFSAAEA